MKKLGYALITFGVLVIVAAQVVAFVALWTVTSERYAQAATMTWILGTILGFSVAAIGSIATEDRR